MDPTLAIDLHSKIEAERLEELAEVNRKFDAFLQALKDVSGITNLQPKKARNGNDAPKVRKPRANKAAAAADAAATSDAPATHETDSGSNDPTTITNPEELASLVDDKLTIFEYLKLATEPQPMSAIVAHMSKFSVAENAVKSAVRALIADGRVTQTGQKRGSRYSAVVTAFD